MAGIKSVSVPVLEAMLATHAAAHPPEREREEIDEAWSVIDENGDGIVSGGEKAKLRELLTTVGEPLTDEELEEFLASIDSNGDGDITRREYFGWMGHTD